MRAMLEAPVGQRLPWRVRRWTERVALASMRFQPAEGEVRVSDGTPTASLIAVGDISFYFYEDPDLVVPSPARPERLLEAVHPALRSADLRVGNLESVVTSATRPAGQEGKFLRGEPAHADVLAAAGFDALTCANNHSLDYGPAALAESLDHLRARGIRTVGVGDTDGAAREPVVMTTHGLSVGMLGYADDFNVYPRWAGAGRIATTVDDEIVRDIRRLRERVDLVVLQLHWGYEWAMYPLPTHRERARRFAEAGADVVLCHHAHVPMAVEAWKGSIVAHGLGNFLFGYSATPIHPWRNRSYLLKVSFGASGVTSGELIPCGAEPDHRTVELQGGPRREVLGAHSVLCGGLSDEPRLAQLEADRVAREALSFVTRFSRFARADDADSAQEFALHLSAPRQRELIGALRDDSRHPAGPELAALLERLATTVGSPRAALLAAREVTTDRVARFARQLAASPYLRGEILGRLP
jgi:poly-gamma-glutamate synthesis protein (capsule biosynthesis protein)